MLARLALPKDFEIRDVLNHDHQLVDAPLGREYGDRGYVEDAMDSVDVQVELAMRGGFGFERRRGRTPVADDVLATESATAERAADAWRVGCRLQMLREVLVRPHDLQRRIDDQESYIAVTHDRGKLLTLALEDVDLGIEQPDQSFGGVESAPERLDGLRGILERL